MQVKVLDLYRENSDQQTGVFADEQKDMIVQDIEYHALLKELKTSGVQLNSK
jgi:hypothetical protein